MLHELDWLPLEYWIKFLVQALTLKVLSRQGQSQLKDRFSWQVPEELSSGRKSLLEILTQG